MVSSFRGQRYTSVESIGSQSRRGTSIDEDLGREEDKGRPAQLTAQRTCRQQDPHGKW